MEESIQSDLDRFLNQISPVHTANADKVEEEDGDVDIDGEEGLPSSAALLKASLARQKGSMLDLKCMGSITLFVALIIFSSRNYNPDTILSLPMDALEDTRSSHPRTRSAHLTFSRCFHFY